MSFKMVNKRCLGKLCRFRRKTAEIKKILHFSRGAIVERYTLPHLKQIQLINLKSSKMKNVVKPVTLKMLIILVVFYFIQASLWAQDSTGSSTTTTTSSTTIKNDTTWYTSPWVWIVGAAVFILLLVALLGGNKNKSSSGSTDRITVTKKVERDTDV